MEKKVVQAWFTRSYQPFFRNRQGPSLSFLLEYNYLILAFICPRSEHNGAQVLVQDGSCVQLQVAWPWPMETGGNAVTEVHLGTKPTHD